MICCLISVLKWKILHRKVGTQEDRYSQSIYSSPKPVKS